MLNTSKKVGAILLTVVMFFVAATALSFTPLWQLMGDFSVLPKASAATYQQYEYTLDENSKATITKYTGGSLSVTVPSAVDGYTVTAIGDSAFKGLNVVFVTIPDTVKSIGSSAFFGCSALSSVNLPSGIDAINSSVFENCTSLTAITIPDSVTEIGGSAFDGCTALKSVKLSKSLTYLGGRAFAYTALESIEIPKALDSCGYSMSRGIYSYTYEYLEKEYSIYGGPFYRAESLKTVTFENGTTQIANHLFDGAVGLESVVMPDTVRTIEDCSFRGALRLNSVKLGGAVAIIEGSSFTNCISLPAITIPDSVTEIGGSAFDCCTALKSVKLSKSLTYLGGRAFGYTALESVEIPKALDSCGYSMSAGIYSYTYEYLEKEYSIYGGPFYRAESLKTVTFEKGTTQIANHLFDGAVGLEAVVIPDTVKTIEDSSFRGSLRLNSVKLGGTVAIIEGSAFANCISLPAITIPDSVTEIGGSAFDCCTALKSVKLSKSLTYLGGRAFGYTALESIEIPKALDSCGYSMSRGIYSYTYEYSEKEYSIYGGPFYCAESLKTVTFEKGTTQIANHLFDGAVGLEAVVIPDTVKTIEDSSFRGSLRLNSVMMGKAVTVLGNSAFSNCASLTDVTIADSVTEFGDNAFNGCASLTEITVPNSVTTIKNAVFQGCTSLKSIAFPDSVASMGDSSLRNCTALESVKLPTEITDVGENFFNNCTSLKSVELPTTVKTIHQSAFYGCTSLEAVTIPENGKLKQIDGSAFKNCVALKGFCVPQSTKTVSANAFEGCEALNDLQFADYSITKINSSTFFECTGLTKVKLPKGLKTIAANAFKNDTGLVEVTIPESVTSIDVTAFSYPQKTVIKGRAGSYAETFANENGFTFTDCTVAVEGMALLDGVDYVTLDRGESYRAVFETYPENATDVITLTASKSNVTIDGMDIYAQSSGDVVITATATSGTDYQFTMHIRRPKSITITTPPAKLSYLLGEALDLTGIVVQVNFDDNTAKKVTNFTTSGFDSSKEGSHDVTVKWTAADGTVYSAKYTVSIVDTRPKLTGIAISTLPKRLSFERKESLDLTGMVVKGTYSDGATRTITDYTVTGYNALKLGKQTLTVTYEGMTATFDVTVANQVVCKLGHSFGSWSVAKAASCTESGTEKRTCSRCNEAETREIPKTAHTEVALKAKAATCTATGLTEGKKCSVCGEVTVAQKSVAKKAHSYKTTTTKATTSKDGSTVKKCTVCGTQASKTAIYKASSIKLSATSYTYDGKAKTPSVTVKDSKGKTLKKDTDYTVKYASGRKSVGKYTVTVTLKGKYSGTKSLSFTINPKATSKITVTQTTTSIKATWSKVSGVTGYKVYIYKGSKLVESKTVSSKTTSYTFKKLTAGTNYTVKVQAYQTVSKVNYWSSTKSLATATKTAAPSVSVKSSAKKNATVSWKKVSGATSYVVYYSASKNGTYKKLATVKGTSYTYKKLTSGKTAYFKVVAVKTVGSTNINSAYSAVKSVKVK